MPNGEVTSDKITIAELERAVSNGFSPLVEVWSMDGVYVVRLHHVHGTTCLSGKDGKIINYKGTGKICEMLGNIGLSSGVLTFPDQYGDEMIGVAGKPITTDDMLAYGTRISFR